MTRTYAILLSGLMAIVGLPGCTHVWKKKPRLSLYTFTDVKDDITIVVKPLNNHESLERLKVNPLKKGYQPIQIRMHNSSGDYYVLHPWQISVPLIAPKQVAREFYINVPTMLGWFLVVGWVGVMWFNPLSYLIPAGIVGIFAWPEANRTMKKRFRHDAISRGVESVIIPPNGSIDRLIFAMQEDATRPFSVSVANQRTNRLVGFDVRLHEMLEDGRSPIS
ncbi:hypothetical protein JW872_01770 [Candidatus Babeliales bacterium]|nr:hypothetical protein [Candidatus Babeliales bacterium]